MREAEHRERAGEIGGAVPESTLAATNRPSAPGTAVGRPVEPRYPELAAEFTKYSGSSRIRAVCCGRPAWFGPRQVELIDAGAALPACLDCMVDAFNAGAQPKSIVSLENPEGARRG